MVGFGKFRTTFGGEVILFSTRLLGSAGGGAGRYINSRLWAFWDDLNIIKLFQFGVWFNCWVGPFAFPSHLLLRASGVETRAPASYWCIDSWGAPTSPAHSEEPAFVSDPRYWTFQVMLLMWLRRPGSSWRKDGRMISNSQEYVIAMDMTIIRNIYQ